MVAPVTIGAVLGERRISLKLTGFGLLFAWHTILIFAPLISNWDYPFAESLWLRQAILCLFIAAAFVAFPLTCQTFYSRVQEGQKGSSTVFFAFGIVGCASTFCALNPISVETLFASTAIAGICEGILMMFWLTNYYSMSSIKTNTGASQHAIIGTALCFILCYTEHHVALIATSLLPVIASFLLLNSTERFRREAPSEDEFLNDIETSIDPSLPEELAGVFARSKQHFEIMILLTIVFGLSFGFIQSSILERHGILIGATDAAPMIGAVLAYLGITAFLRFSDSKIALIIELVFSFIAFSFGALGASRAASDITLIVFGGVLIFGFHLFDFAVLAITIDTAENGRTSPILRIGANRAAVYFSYGAAFFIGNAIVANFEGISEGLLSSLLLLVLIIVLVLYIGFAMSVRALPSSVDEDDAIDVPNNESHHNGEQLVEEVPQEPDEIEPSDRCKIISEQYRLTPREGDVLEFLAKGRNAAYIAQALWISPLTAKTHIANIYRKLDVHSSQELLDLIDQQG